MKVWIINEFAVPATRSGVTRHHALARELRKQGIDVTIVSSNVEYLSRREIDGDNRAGSVREVIDGVPFIWIRTPRPSRRVLARLGSMLYFAFGVFRGRWMRDLDPPDVVLGSSPSIFASFAASQIARRLKCPFILEVRDIWPQSVVDLGRFSEGHPSIRVMAAMERTLYRRAARIVSVLPMAAEHFERVVPGAASKTVWIPNGVEIPEGAPPATPVRATEGAPFAAMYAGSHGIANGLDVVLDAAHKLQDEVHDDELQIRFVGDGQLKEQLKQRVATEEIDGVRFEPPVSKHQLPDKLAEADAFFMVLQDSPVFRWGVSPNKLFDYMLAARPIIYGINTPYNPVEKAQAGVTVPASDPVALAEAVRTLLSLSDAEREAMGARARAYVEEHHAMSKLSVDLARVLREVTA